MLQAGFAQIPGKSGGGDLRGSCEWEDLDVAAGLVHTASRQGASGETVVVAEWKVIS